MEEQNNHDSHGHQHEGEHVNLGSGEKHHDGKTLFGVLCYLGPLVIIPLLTKSDDHFLKFHAKQGLVLLIAEIISSILLKGMFMWLFFPIYQIISIAAVVLSIMGIVNVVQGREKELPLIGGIAHYLKF